MNKLISVFKNGCTIFTVLTLVLYIIDFALGSNADKLSSQLILLAVCILLSSSFIFFKAKMPTVLQFTLHFVLTCAIIVSLPYLINGNAVTPVFSLLLAVCYALVYISVSAIRFFVTERIQKKNSDKEKYNSIFK